MFYVPPADIDAAWRDGASALAEACKRSDGDTDAEHLLAALKAGAKTLLGHSGGWVVVEVQTYPIRRVLHVDAIHAPGMTTPEVFAELEAFARHNGCNAIQGACQPAVARLWKRKFGFREAYAILRKDLP